MPPHCDSMDGPVVLAARRALDAGDPRFALPFVKAEGEAEVLEAFKRTMAAHDGNRAVNELADRYFFETIVRVHRVGEGAPYTGLKPAGLGFGPVVPVTERAIESGSPDELVQVLTEKVRREVLERFSPPSARSGPARSPRRWSSGRGPGPGSRRDRGPWSPGSNRFGTP